jgi:hypothetical protein
MTVTMSCVSARYRADFCTAWDKSLRWFPWTDGMYSVQHCHDFKVTTFLIFSYSPCVSSDSFAYSEMRIALLVTLAISLCVQGPDGVCTTRSNFSSQLNNVMDRSPWVDVSSFAGQFPASCRTWNSVTVFQFLSHAIWTHSVPSNSMSLKISFNIIFIISWTPLPWSWSLSVRVGRFHPFYRSRRPLGRVEV